MKTRLIFAMLLIATVALADGMLCFFKDTVSKAEKKAIAVDLKDGYSDKGDVAVDTLPLVYLGMNTNDVWRRLHISNDQAKWFAQTGKQLPTTNSLTTSISSTLAQPTNAVFLSVKGMDWKTVQDKAGYHDFTNTAPKQVTP